MAELFFSQDEIVIPKSLADARLVMSRFYKQVRARGAYALDTETSGLSWTSDKLLMISLYTPGMAVVLPLAWGASPVSVDNIADLLGKLTRDKNLRVYLHNAKFDMHFLYNHGVYLSNELHDTCLIGFDMDVTKPAKLKLRAREELGLEMAEFKDKFKIGGVHKLTLLDYPAAEVGKYAALDVFATYNLADKFLSESSESDPYHCSVYVNHEDPDIAMLYDRIDQKIVPVLWDMERAGVRVDVPALRKAKADYTAEIEQSEKAILKEAGVAFNLNSPKQVTQVFARRGVALSSTDEKNLTKLAVRGEKLARLMLEYRKKQKIISTYIDTMLENRDSSDRVHTGLNLHVAETGRLSSSVPLNLQNQPKERWWREMFIASPGHALIVRDFSQIELRILAVVSEDPVLLNEYAHGADVHMNNGLKIAETLGKDVKKLTKDELKHYRDLAKRSLSFGERINS